VAPERGALRLTRSAFFALAAVGLACSAHLAGGGEAVSAPVALLSVPAVMIVINVLAGRQRGPGILLFAMALTQCGLHLAFMAASITGSCQAMGAHPMPPMAGMPAGSGPSAQLAMQCGPAMAHGGAAGGLWPSTPMLLAHALAGVLLVLLLAHGEKAVWALAACLRFRFVLPDRPALLLPAVRRLPVAAYAAVRPGHEVHLRTLRRRGPPGLLLAVP
jgi:hypothetical protein